MDAHTLHAMIEATPEALRYLVPLGLAYVENILLWLPGDIVGVSTALLAATGELDMLPAMAAVAVGGWGGFLTWFEMARRIALACRQAPLTGSMRSRRIATAVRCLRRHGCWLVLGYRFFPGFRTSVAVSAGLLTLNRRRVWALSLVSALAWNTLVMVFAGGLIDPGRSGLGALPARVPWPLWAGAALAVATIIVLKRCRAAGKRPANPALPGLEDAEDEPLPQGR